MEWSKLKNIILIILTAVNLFLLLLVLQKKWENYQFSHSAREDAVAILQETGHISLDAALLPKEMELAPMVVSPDAGLEEKQASALLGASVQKSGPMRYAGEKGSAQFYLNGEYSATFLPESWPLNGEDPGAFVLQLLRGMGMEAEVLSISGEENADVTVRQEWGGVPIFNCTAVLSVEEGELRAIRSSVSHRLVGEPKPLGSESPRKLTTLLLDFLDYVMKNGRVCGEITGFTAGYQLDTQQESTRLIPTWYVTTDQGAYYWNAMTGEITPEK